MITKEETAETEIIFRADEDWQNQLSNLEETFKDFYLLKYKQYESNNHFYNKFVFTHSVEVKVKY